MLFRRLHSGLLLLLSLATLLTAPNRSGGAQVGIEVFGPAREAAQAIQAARQAQAAERAPRELRPAERSFEEAARALNPPSAQPDVARATHLFRLAAAEGRLAEARAIEIMREREAAAAGFQYLDAIEPDPKGFLPPRPPLTVAAAEYRRLQRGAAQARAARRAAQEVVERLRQAS